MYRDIKSGGRVSQFNFFIPILSPTPAIKRTENNRKVESFLEQF